MEDPLVGEVIGGCRLERLLGKGGMGSVYRAVRLADQVDVAVKLLDPRLEADPEYVERFLRESRAVAVVDHPNVVQLLDVGQEHGQHYLVLEFVDGETLEALLGRERRLPGRRAAAVASAIAAGLGALHDRGVVHRDTSRLPASSWARRSTWRPSR
jgi:eukaryotic-like serine/threonine-protein kinase